MSSERCEAFEFKEPDDLKVARYFRNGMALPLISKIMLSLQEDPMERDRRLKEHCDKVEERAALRKIATSLPLREADDQTKLKHKTDYLEEKQKVRHASPHPSPTSQARGLCRQLRHLCRSRHKGHRSCPTPPPTLMPDSPTPFVPAPAARAQPEGRVAVAPA